jgi:hypothetical protein
MIKYFTCKDKMQLTVMQFIKSILEEYRKKWTVQVFFSGL